MDLLQKKVHSQRLEMQRRAEQPRSKPVKDIQWVIRATHVESIAYSVFRAQVHNRVNLRLPVTFPEILW
jgi:hypothetical protein